MTSHDKIRRLAAAAVRMIEAEEGAACQARLSARFARAATSPAAAVEGPLASLPLAARTTCEPPLCCPPAAAGPADDWAA